MLQRFTSVIGNVKTREKFIRKERRSMEEALSIARAFAAAANATGGSLDSTFGAVAISVAESKPAYNVSDNHWQFSNCIYCQRFGSAAQRCGHNPSLRFPRSHGYWPPSRQTNQGFTAVRGKSPSSVLFVPSVSCQNSHSLLFCSVGLDGCAALTIIDTGAACTVVRSKFCPEVRPYQRELRTANGTVFQTKGSSRINVTIGSKIVPQEVCVSDAIPWDGIIGLDLPVRAWCTIGLQRRMLRVGEEYVKLPSGRSFTEEPNPDLWSLEIAPVNLQAQVDSSLSSCNREVSEEAVGQLKAVVLANESAFAWEGAPPDLLKTHQLAREHLATAQNYRKDYCDRKVRGSPLQPGEQVYLQYPVSPPGDPAKLHKEWVGPYIVREIYNETTCRISRADSQESQSFTVHFNRLKPATQCIKYIGDNPSTSGVTPPDAAVFEEVAAEGGLSIVQGSSEDTANQSGAQCNGTSQGSSE
ncbi:hypothetical protein EG68_12118 [Paragonimus skrjabini miyazakii]|uniref:Peptidase A2 domain-containing protein n=1 Tax=Paragonimus skrjabini miyazakii TaxID=59628 RepID=A0A8S9YNQ0_9TREM|nr:hypothetical protein EG68_12118 [Paragonimus skrjabini miyazakii]